MKLKKLLFIIPLLAGLVGCNKGVDTTSVIDSLLNGFNVTVSGTETITYPDNYTYLNKVNQINIDRDYCNIKNSDGTITHAVRENTNYAFTTYFEGPEGETIMEVYKEDNTVSSVQYKVNGNLVLFNEKFENPFIYIDEADLSSDYKLNKAKANLIVEEITGYQVAVKNAKLIVKDGKAIGLDVDFIDRIDAILTETDELFVKHIYEMNISFNYGVKKIAHLKPKAKADSNVNKAFEEKSNFTLTFNSNATYANTIIYVTDNAIYQHNGINVVGAAAGDVYFKKVGDSYERYAYNKNSNKWNLEQLDVKRSAILPDLSVVSSNLVEKIGDTIYSLDYASSYFTLDNFVIPSYSLGNGFGISATLKIENGNLVSFVGMFNVSKTINIVQNYFDYGTTSIPSWLDVSLIK